MKDSCDLGDVPDMKQHTLFVLQSEFKFLRILDDGEGQSGVAVEELVELAAAD